MQRALTVLFVLFGLFAWSPEASAAVLKGRLETWRGIVEGTLYRHDGDTFWIGPVQVRIFGIDSPEKSTECKIDGEERPKCNVLSMDGLGDLIYLGVICTAVGRHLDRFNRWVAKCTTQDGADLGQALITEGFACADKRFLKGDEQENIYIAAESGARAAKLGLWGIGFEFLDMCREKNEKSSKARLRKGAVQVPK
jgi:endonuclease YncB( thermonuclease family)